MLANLKYENTPCLFIMGMHRSGTSATTGALRCLGVELGKNLYHGHTGINPKGYFENSKLADTNDEILYKIGSSWDDILPREDSWWKSADLAPLKSKLSKHLVSDFSGSPLWAVKDPRMCRLLPLWLEIMESLNRSPHFLFVIRSPEEVYQSLNKRDGFSREKALLLWNLHYLEAVTQSEGYNRSFMTFDNFLSNPTKELGRIERELGLEFPIPVSAAHNLLDKFVSKNLRHHSSLPSSSNEKTPLNLITRNLENKLKMLSNSDAEKTNVNFTDTEKQLSDYLASFNPTFAEHARSIARSRGNEKLALIRIFRSWSWVAGKPIRFIERLLGRDV